MSGLAPPSQAPCRPAPSPPGSAKPEATPACGVIANAGSVLVCRALRRRDGGSAAAASGGPRAMAPPPCTPLCGTAADPCCSAQPFSSTSSSCCASLVPSRTTSWSWPGFWHAGVACGLLGAACGGGAESGCAGVLPPRAARRRPAARFRLPCFAGFAAGCAATTTPVFLPFPRPPLRRPATLSSGSPLLAEAVAITTVNALGGSSACDTSGMTAQGLMPAAPGASPCASSCICPPRGARLARLTAALAPRVSQPPWTRSRILL